MQKKLPNDNVVRLLADYVRLYGGEESSQKVIGDFVERKCREKEVFECYKLGIITQDEVCNFLLGHVHSRFVSNALLVNEEQVGEFRCKLKSMLFGE